VADANYLVGVDDLRAALGVSGTRIIDCRFELMAPEAGRSAYLQGHIPGAVYADLDQDLAAPVSPGTGRHPLPDPVQMAATFERLGISNSNRVIVYDDSAGAIAARAWWLLRWLGHDDAAILDGGFRAWQGQGMPIEEGAAAVTPGVFVHRPRDELVLGTDEIHTAERSAAALALIDVRSAERYTGREEPIDKIGGHIPGAINLPYTDYVEADGRWKSVGEIRRRLADALGPPAAQSWSVMCGSGVTACHLVVAGLLAGYPEPRVYVGSWSEWITDSSREVATGPDRAPGSGPENAEYP
jgi:thiosulfate/3-mercaptopyruvate sulfurtransferase